MTGLIQKPQEVIEHYLKLEDKPNVEGKRDIISESLELMSDKEVEWLYKLIITKFTGGHTNARTDTGKKAIEHTRMDT